MRILEMGPEAKRSVDAVVAFSARPENYYIPGVTQYVAGDRPEHTCQLNDFRCVFTITKKDGILWRHLSISVPSAIYPHPAAAFTIAQMFGFEGWDGKDSSRLPDGWLGGVSEGEHCIVLVQPYGGGEQA